MPGLIALAVIALVLGLAGLFAVLAVALHRDFRQWDARFRGALERDAQRLIRELFDARRHSQ